MASAPQTSSLHDFQVLPAGRLDQALDSPDGNYFVPYTTGGRGGTHVVVATVSGVKQVSYSNMLRYRNSNRSIRIMQTQSLPTRPTNGGDVSVVGLVWRTLVTITKKGNSSERKHTTYVLAVIKKDGKKTYIDQAEYDGDIKLVRPGDVFAFSTMVGKYVLVKGDRENKPYTKGKLLVIKVHENGTCLVYHQANKTHYNMPCGTLPQQACPGLICDTTESNDDARSVISSMSYQSRGGHAAAALAQPMNPNHVNAAVNQWMSMAQPQPLFYPQHYMMQQPASRGSGRGKRGGQRRRNRNPSSTEV